MRHPGWSFLLILTALVFLAPAAARAQQVSPTPSPEIAGIRLLSPLPGQVLQGTVPINANTAIPDFQSAELSFAYENDTTGTWFLITQASQPVSNGTLIEWDTSTISDGEYTLTLNVTLTNGGQESVRVTGLRVRNYSPSETDTPTPMPATATARPDLAPTASLTSTPQATLPPPLPTPLPYNPAEIHTQDMLISLGKGALAAIGLFALGGLYWFLRNLGRK